MDRKTITAFLVDDEINALMFMHDLLVKHSKFKIVGQTTNSEDAFEEIVKLKPDVIFLDIEMPRKNGFQIVEMLKDQSQLPEIVFTTGFNKYAVEAIRHSAMDFLLKPVNIEELRNCVHRIEEAIETKNTNSDMGTNATNITKLFKNLAKNNGASKIKFNNRTGFILIDPVDILSLTASGNYTIMDFVNHTEDTVTMQIGVIESLLPQGDFLRINKSSTINLSYLQKVDYKKREATLAFNNTEKVFTVSRNKIKYLRNSF